MYGRTKWCIFLFDLYVWKDEVVYISVSSACMEGQSGVYFCLIYMCGRTKWCMFLSV